MVFYTFGSKIGREQLLPGGEFLRSETGRNQELFVQILRNYRLNSEDHWSAATPCVTARETEPDRCVGRLCRHDQS